MRVLHPSNSALLRAFDRRNVKHLVIGGMAVHHYCPERCVIGKDLDLLTDPEEENVERIVLAFGDLKVDGIHFDQPTLQQIPILLTKPCGRVRRACDLFVDILTPPKSFEFDTLFRNSIAVEEERSGVPVCIVSCFDLVCLKAHAYNKDGQEKHKQDLELLRKYCSAISVA